MVSEMELYPHCDQTIWLRTCKEEITKPLEGVLIGTMPKWINGKLFRNGPGASNLGQGLEFGHLFDNFGLIHGFNISNGHVTYQCQFVKSDYYKRIQSKRMLLTEFGTKSVADPCNTIFHRVKSIFDPIKASSDNTMISMYPFGDEIYAFGESPIIYRINKDSLNTEKSENTYNRVGVINHSAHPHIDQNGDIYNIGVSYSKYGLVHNVFRFPKHDKADEMFNKAQVVATIPSRRLLNPSYMHSFGITESYFILIQQPLSISITKFVKSKLFNEPLISSLQWDETMKTRIDVISRKTGKIAKSFYTSSLFFLHVINQYQQGNKIIIDICCYDDPKMIDCMYTEALKNMQSNPDYAKLFRGRPKRFILNLKGSSTVQGRNICDLGCETPQINYAKYLGHYYRYFYAINSDVDCRYPGTVIKVDVETGHTLTWCEDNCYPSEPIFIPCVDSQREDDGILISSMVWGREHTNKIGVLVLDAQTMKEICRWVFDTPSAVPKCLHGWYAPQKHVNGAKKQRK